MCSACSGDYEYDDTAEPAPSKTAGHNAGAGLAIGGFASRIFRPPEGHALVANLPPCLAQANLAIAHPEKRGWRRPGDV